MKIVIIGARAEGKTKLLEVIRRRVLRDYGSECHILDGGAGGEQEHFQGVYPIIKVFVTNDLQEAISFLTQEE